jgi:hypothetical protein
VRAEIALVSFLYQMLLSSIGTALDILPFFTGLFDVLFINEDIDKSVEQAVKTFTTQKV